MQVPADSLAQVGEAARAVIRQARAAGVHRFAGGSTHAFYAHTRALDRGWCVLAHPDDEAAWPGRPGSPPPAAVRRHCARSRATPRAEWCARRCGGAHPSLHA
jgi:hypothetical protein